MGIARARDIAGGKSLSEETIGRMASFFARHEVDKQGKGWSPSDDGYPSNGRIAWALWGGDAGRTWAEKVAGQLERTVSVKPMHLFSSTAYRFALPDLDDAIGKWSRAGTYGDKSSKGAGLVFGTEALSTFIDNARDRGDEIGIDQDHKTAYVETTGQPAPSLGFFDGIALFKAGTLVNHWTRDGSEPPGPTGYRDEVRDGLYFRLGRLTPLGRDPLQGLANYSGLSLLFSANGEAEDGTPIGPCIHCVAATSTPFLAGTPIEFSRANVSPTPTTTAGARRFGASTMNPDMMKKLGLADDADDAAKMAALMKYAADCDAKMAKMGELEIKHDTDEEKAVEEFAAEVGVEAGPKTMSRALVAFRAKFAPQSEIAALKGEVHKLSQSIAARDKADADAQLATFADTAIADGRWDAAKREHLVTFARADRKAAEASLQPKGTYTLLGKIAVGLDGSRRPAVNSGEDAKVTFSAKVKEYAAANGLRGADGFLKASEIVGKANPDLLRASMGLAG